MTIGMTDLSLKISANKRIVAPDQGVPHGQLIDELVQKAYDECLSVPMKFRQSGIAHDTILESVMQLELIKSKALFTTEQFRILYTLMAIHEPQTNDYCRSASAYLTEAMKNMYAAGIEHEFTLEDRDNKWDYLAYRLVSDENRRLRITMNGKAGSEFGFEAEGVDFTILQDAGHGCGVGAKDSSYSIAGNAGGLTGFNSCRSVYDIHGYASYYLGKDADHSLFVVHSHVSSFCGTKSRGSVFDIRGNAREGCGTNADGSIFIIGGTASYDCGSMAENCVFCVHDRKLYSNLNKTLEESNMLILCDRSGRIIKMRNRR